MSRSYSSNAIRVEHLPKFTPLTENQGKAYEDWNDQEIWKIMNDEIQHFQELRKAMEMIK